MCSCNQGKNKDGSAITFVVTKADGTKTEVRSAQEARAIVRISGGSFTQK